MAIPKFRAQPVLRSQGPCSLSRFLLTVCEGTGRSPQAGQLLKHVVCLCLSGPMDHCVSASFLLCLVLCVFLRLCGLMVALCLSISFCSCGFVPSWHLHKGLYLTSNPLPLHCSTHHSAPERRGPGSHPGGAHSSSPTASSPTRPGLSAGSGEAQSSRVDRLSSSVQLSWTRVDLFISSIELSRSSIS